MSWEGERPFQVVRKIDECQDVASLWLRPQDEARLPSFAPGQYLTLRFPGLGDPPQIRCYSLSLAPDPTVYRISVKRVAARGEHPPGRVSAHVVEQVQAGDTLWIRAPQGNFAIDPYLPQARVYLAGGIGLTPFMSMLQAQAEAGAPGETHLFCGMRRGAEFPFADELERLCAAHEGLHLHRALSRPEPGERAERVGRLDLPWIQERVGRTLAGFQVYLCGPPPFVESLSAALEAAGQPPERVHVEAFTQRTLRPFTRRLQRSLAGELERAQVTFARSGVTLPWSEEANSILDLALGGGVFFPFACGVGHCGTCHSRLLEGEVAYPVPPQFAVREGHCLPCVATPRGSLAIDR